MPQTLSQESDPSQPCLDSSQLEVLEMLTSFNTDEDMTGEDSDYLTGSWNDGDFQHDGWRARTRPISRWNVESGSTSYSESEFVSPSYPLHHESAGQVGTLKLQHLRRGALQ